jgi:predicted ATPase
MLRKIKTTNYRNLDLSEGIEFGSLNIFVGSNGSGKTNLIDLVEFLKNAVTPSGNEDSGTYKIEGAIWRSRKIFLDKSVDFPAEIDIEYYFDAYDKADSLLILKLKLLVNKSASTEIPTLRLEHLARKSSDNNEEPFYYYKSHDREIGKGVVSVFNENHYGSSFEVVNDIPTTRLTLESINSLLELLDISPSKTPVYQVRRSLINELSKWYFYNSNHMNLKSIIESEPKAGQSDTFLSSYAENFTLVLQNLINDSIEFEEEINHAAKAIRPDSQRIRTVLTGLLSLTVQWKISGIADPFRLDELSDGTVRMLCWATILRSHKLPSLIVIEEPEVGIHPAWLKVLAEWIKLAAERTQVIITTHSPDLLDCFTDRLENVYVFNKKQDDPHHFVIDRLSHDRFQSLLDEGWELGDIYRVGDPTLGGWPW